VWSPPWPARPPPPSLPHTYCGRIIIINIIIIIIILILVIIMIIIIMIIIMIISTIPS
jgi:hypothetical protein